MKTLIKPCMSTPGLFHTLGFCTDPYALVGSYSERAYIAPRGRLNVFWSLNGLHPLHKASRPLKRLEAIQGHMVKCRNPWSSSLGRC